MRKLENWQAGSKGVSSSEPAFCPSTALWGKGDKGNFSPSTAFMGQDWAITKKSGSPRRDILCWEDEATLAVNTEARRSTVASWASAEVSKSELMCKNIYLAMLGLSCGM